MAHGRSQSKRLGEDLDEAGGAELSGLGEVEHAVAGAVELGAQLAKQRGLARAGLAGQQGEGLGVFEQGVAQGEFDANEVLEGKGGAIHGSSPVGLAARSCRVKSAR